VVCLHNALDVKEKSDSCSLSLVEYNNTLRVACSLYTPGSGNEFVTTLIPVSQVSFILCCLLFQFIFNNSKRVLEYFNYDYAIISRLIVPLIHYDTTLFSNAIQCTGSHLLATLLEITLRRTHYPYPDEETDDEASKRLPSVT
jgi:hypothetical protein